MTDSLGRLAFEAYSRAPEPGSRGYVNPLGEISPKWENLGDAVRARWQAAAVAVRDRLMLPDPLACPLCAHSLLFHDVADDDAPPMCCFGDCPCGKELPAVAGISAMGVVAVDTMVDVP